MFLSFKIFLSLTWFPYFELPYIFIQILKDAASLMGDLFFFKGSVANQSKFVTVKI